MYDPLCMTMPMTGFILMEICHYVSICLLLNKGLRVTVTAVDGLDDAILMH